MHCWACSALKKRNPLSKICSCLITALTMPTKGRVSMFAKKKMIMTVRARGSKSTNPVMKCFFILSAPLFLSYFCGNDVPAGFKKNEVDIFEHHLDDIACKIGDGGPVSFEMLFVGVIYKVILL